MLLLKAAVVIPDVTISSLLWLMIAALPGTVGFVITVVGIALGALLAAGLGEDAVVLEAQAGRWPSPTIIASFLSLTYVLPITRRTWERQLTLPGWPRLGVTRCVRGATRRTGCSLA